MSKMKLWFILFLAVCLTVVCVVEISAQSSAKDSGISIRKIKEEVVLYTIFRGSYDKAGQAIGELYALAGSKGISPRGGPYYVYLNNPNNVSSEHWLTEVRIPVSKEALKAAGTLGKMTDVKVLPAIEAAVAVKPKGQGDPSGIYDRLYSWVFKQGYITSGSVREVFLMMGGSYAQMKTEIMIPIQKYSPAKD